MDLPVYLYVLVPVLALAGWYVARRARVWYAWWIAGRERLPVVDERGEVTGEASRRRCHGGARLLHPVVHLHVPGPRGEVLLQRRGMHKKLLPGRWDSAVGGHVSAGERVEEALKRESLEEMGITHLKVRFLGSYIWEGARERELVYAFLCVDHDEVRANPGEVLETRYWSCTAIENPANASLFTPNFLHEYALFLRPVLHAHPPVA
jgi:isopentenyldiphosphate isomerase